MPKNPKILVVDDDKVSLALFEEILGGADKAYKLILANSGRMALDIVEKDKPDLILLDIVLPDIDGFELCLQIKSRPSFKDVPVILVTALEKAEEKVVGFRVGASDYVVKPINSEEMRMRVATQLKIKRYQDELKEVNEELKRTQAASIESAKMSAVGSLTAGIAHEFNNILGLMKGFIQLQEGNNDLVSLRQGISVLGGLITRGEELIQGLLDFSREGSFFKRQLVDISTLLKEDMFLLKKKLEDNGIKLEMDFSSIPLLSCYPNQLSQVFINMALNSIDAMEKSLEKKLTISVKKCASGSEGYCNIDGSHKCESDNGCLVVVVKDTGCGISEKIHDKIFEPFVTTKGVLGGGDSSKPGTGLGLSMAYGIIKRHKGFIFFNSRPGEGTEFFIVLPVIVDSDVSADSKKEAVL
jgi:signal transduction histidine kinase